MSPTRREFLRGLAGVAGAAAGTHAGLAFYRGAARDWTVCDNYSAAIMAETYPNRFYQHAAQTDRLHNSTAAASMPTIWDRLDAARLTGRYYFSDAPFTALWGTK